MHQNKRRRGRGGGGGESSRIVVVAAAAAVSKSAGENNRRRELLVEGGDPLAHAGRRHGGALRGEALDVDEEDRGLGEELGAELEAGGAVRPRVPPRLDAAQDGVDGGEVARGWRRDEVRRIVANFGWPGISARMPCTFCPVHRM